MSGTVRNASWARDEVLLAVDVLLSNDGKTLSVNSEAIHELSKLLNSLPIIPEDFHTESFRNCVGVHRQLAMLQGAVTENKAAKIGRLFFDVYEDYKDRQEELHQIAKAIKSNAACFRHVGFGITEESYGFPEGSLLSHLHRYIEVRDTPDELSRVSSCQVCGISLDGIYQGNLELENHLTVPPTRLDYHVRYKSKDYICVCPNCHTALHRLRPWRTAEDCEQILK